MIDIKTVRNNPEVLKKALENRHAKFDIDGFLALDEKRRGLLVEVEQLKNKQNTNSKLIPQYKKEGKDVSALMEEMKALSDAIKELDAKVNAIDEEIEKIVYTIPNIPNETVPVGASDSDNLEMRRWEEPRKFEFEPKAHWDIGESLGILDFSTAGKVTGARFTFYKGLGARLERALVNFMLDLHIEKHGYTEVFPPFMVHRNSMVGTGQLPKFEEDAFKVWGTEYFLIPTAEVPVTNMYREQILDLKDLPIKHAAYSACFRAEAGAAGRDTRGLIRQHQFNKVELVKFCLPETSYDELESLTKDAEEVLQLLGLPYRVVKLCTGDLGFSSAMTYDLEVWMPSYNRYVEISSCSNFESFQARRAGIRFRRGPKDKPEFVHTLNGSGVAVGRTTACILETYQQPDGSVKIPEPLIKYMNGIDVIK
ncbi:MAG: serine--tRNA ligase [Clostridiales bacterium]|jgi:seryl-tRNA synthetase|nr:serine--tRNA ligase [Eubacteriales bacterium]MDH7567069.1 serine--tRNA ligase [Clostridiales bacterium]